jgi:HEAT repeat protein
MSKRSQQKEGATARSVGRENAVRVQVLLLTDHDPEVRVAALHMLGNFGASAKEEIPRLREMLFHEEDSMVLEAVWESLIRIGADTDSLVSAMMDRLKSLHQGSRTQAAELLARFAVHTSASSRKTSTERLLPELLAILRKENENPRIRRAIIQLLGVWELKPKQVAPELANLLKDKDEGIRKMAMQALEHFRPASAACAPMIVQCLRSRPDDISWHYAWWFFDFMASTWRMPGSSAEKCGRDADLIAPALIDAIGAKDSKIRMMGASILGELGEHASLAIPALCGALKDKDRQVRWEAARSLGRLGACALQAVPALIEARQHPDRNLRAEADEALRRITPDKYAAILLSESLSPGSVIRPSIVTMARYLGDGRCQVGADPEFRIEEKEAYVLEAIVELRAADKKSLIERSGVADAPRILKRIREKYLKLAPHIVCPGRRGRGGYSTTIVRA